MKNRSKQQSIHFFVYLILAIVVFISIFPILWMTLISLKDVSESISGFNSIRIIHLTVDNYLKLFNQIPIASNIFNSVFSTAMGTITTVFFCALAGFSFAKYKFPGRDFLFYFVIATMLIPPEVGAIPLFIIMKKLHLINSLWSLVIPRIATAVGIFYMRQYIINVPDELLEAAEIDGCKDFKIFYRIILPVIKPALASWASLTIVARWNDFFWPLLFLRKTSKHTLMVSISMLPVSDGLSTPWQVILAGTTIVILPIVFSYLVLQHFHKEGLTAGSVKG